VCVFLSSFSSYAPPAILSAPAVEKRETSIQQQLKLAMAASLLSAVEPIIKGKAFEDLCKASFPVSGLISVETARVALQSAKELLSNDGEYTLVASSVMCWVLGRLVLLRGPPAARCQMGQQHGFLPPLLQVSPCPASKSRS
jgi:hypothetical protein